MFKNILYIILCFNLFFVYGNAQNIDPHQSVDYQLITADSDLLYSFTTIYEKNGNVSQGFLVGLKNDSLIISRTEKHYCYSLGELLSVSIELKNSSYKGFIYGGIIGVYLSSLAFFRSDDQTGAYTYNSDIERMLILGTLFGTACGGVGYLIENNSTHDNLLFGFSKDPEQSKNEMNRLRKLIKSKKSENRFHFTIQLAQVKSRFSDLPNFNDNYLNSTNFNLLRKLDITYSVTESIEVGGSVCWFGEPYFFYSNYDENNYGYTSIMQSYDGIGYYAISSYQPLKNNILSDNLIWKIGCGIGIGHIEYKLTKIKENYQDQEYTTESKETNLNQNAFSTIFYTNLNILLYDNLSIGFAADYVFLKENISAIPELNLNNESLGNYSLGFNFTLLF